MFLRVLSTQGCTSGQMQYIRVHFKGGGGGGVWKLSCAYSLRYLYQTGLKATVHKVCTQVQLLGILIQPCDLLVFYFFYVSGVKEKKKGAFNAKSLDLGIGLEQLAYIKC